MTDLRVLDQRALRTVEVIIGRIDVARLDVPTPCGEWTLRRLLEHIVGQNHGFAAAARGETKDRTVFADRPVGDDPAGAFAASAAEVAASFGAEGALERGWWLPEIRAGRVFPAPVAVGFHFVNTVVHGWDVARSIGVEAEFDAEVLKVALSVAEAMAAGKSRPAADEAFGPAVADAGTGAPLDRIAAILGRSPDWPAGVQGPARPLSTPQVSATTPTYVAHISSKGVA
ncbi:TIGR03086 family metal-binding protein [Streptomyces sp. H10-C2]|uniref:TIGR03086 family metal-binding protein n=1 Tax=unclassified Streptomyces TaxID=2593676 RepID=UPI0024B8A837|nr:MULTISPECIES: TIGR03086 family metal-binding protein [unclassified Streptomyces]MDJ0340842.1 TIGR03086 family metal-binding protein [Streptomyces sp. PH10-H1]MDJ0371682.1 TIGR03086 family metal-binding protein [Streptomyces sp. H10-C2]